jgi:hypothetical protein
MKRCAKHRRKAIYEWRICSAHGDAQWEGVCAECDLELNRIALQWRFPKTWKKRFEAYKQRSVE